MKIRIPSGLLPERISGMFLLIILGAGIGALSSTLLCGGQSDTDAPTSQAHAGHGEKATIWTCSMHPQIRQPEPGQCPMCGMDLIPLRDDGDEPGPNTVVLSERAKILARINTTPVRRLEEGGTDRRLLGRIEPSEAAMKDVTAWTGGRIDRLHVKVTGQSVRKGQVTATLYSPEVFAAHQDLIVAKRQVTRMQESTETARHAAERAFEASKNRLRLLGVPGGEIEQMAAASKPTRQIAIRTPFGGTVMERVATEGAYVRTGALLYKVADLSRVWVQLDAYESDLPGIAKGQSVALRVEGIPDDVFEGEVDFIDPVIDPNRRTARVRVAVKNKGRRLRPGMFAEADIRSENKSGGSPPLIVPGSAPLFTGRRAIVFVEETNADRPTYTARTVRLGPKTGDAYPVVAGLEAGERVVTKGAFVLDADLQIRGGNSMMAAPDDATASHDVMIRMTAKERQRLRPVVDAYLEVQERLAADDFDATRTAAESLGKAAEKAGIDGPTPAVELWKTLGTDIAAHAEHLSGADNIEAARGVFETVSHHIISLLERLGNPLESPVRLSFCPMAMGSKGAFWVQRGEVVDNSYFGDAMRTCGEIRQTVAPGAYLIREKPADGQITSASAEGHRH